MLTVLTNCVRPRLGQLHNYSSHGISASVRRTIIPPLRRQLKLCDAFTILLTPVLTAAFVLDFTSKDRKSQEWDRKIAEVVQQVELLKEKEFQVWESLRCRPFRLGIGQQRRGYATEAALQPQIKWKTSTISEDPESFIQDDLTQDDGTPSSKTHGAMSRAQSDDLTRYENLLAIKLGLHFLFHIYGHRRPSGWTQLNHLADGVLIPDNMEQLHEYLNKVNQDLRHLNERLPDDSPFLVFHPANSDLDHQIRLLAYRCRTGAITFPKFAHIYTQTMMKSKTGLSLQTYRSIVVTLSILDMHTETFIAMSPIWRTKQVLSDKIISTAIYQLGKIRESGRITMLLRDLVESRRSFRVETSWKYVIAGGFRVAVPAQHRPRILDTLIRTALQAEQPDKARAWAALLVAGNTPPFYLANMLSNFLFYCSVQRNWREGKIWLLRTIDTLAYIAHNAPGTVQKLVFRMLDLCFVCDRPERYNWVMDAATSAGIDVPPIDSTRPEFSTSRSYEIRREWSTKLDELTVVPKDLQYMLDAARKFQSKLAEKEPIIEAFVGAVNLKDIQKLISAAISTYQTVQNGTGEGNISSDFDSGSWSDEMLALSTDRILTSAVDVAPCRDFGPPILDDDKQGELADEGASTFSGRPILDELRDYMPLFDEENGNRPSDKRDTANDLEVKPLISAHSSKLAPALDSDSRFQQLLRRVESSEKENEELRMNLLASQDKQDEFDRVVRDLQSRVNMSSRKSLETVFLEKENLNLRAEMKIISEQLQAVHGKTVIFKGDFDRDRAQYETREKELKMTLDILTNDNERLRNQLAAAEVVIKDGQVSQESKQIKEDWQQEFARSISTMQKEIAALKANSRSTVSLSNLTESTLPDAGPKGQGIAVKKAAIQQGSPNPTPIELIDLDNSDTASGSLGIDLSKAKPDTIELEINENKRQHSGRVAPVSESIRRVKPTKIERTGVHSNATGKKGI